LQIFKETKEEVWLEYAVSCFFQGIKYGVSNSRSHLARILYLLSFDTQNEPVGRALDKYLEQLPHWVWLSWIPQLLLSLQRSEAQHCKLVLLKIAQVYPQVNQSYCVICLYLTYEVYNPVPAHTFLGHVTGIILLASYVLDGTS
jgi:hypothetical protein